MSNNPPQRSRDQDIREMFDAKSNSIAKSQEQKDRELALKALELELYKDDIDLRERDLQFRISQYNDRKAGLFSDRL